MKDVTSLEEHERGKEIETLRQKHAETIDEIDQVFVRVSLFFGLMIAEWVHVSSSTSSPR